MLVVLTTAPDAQEADGLAKAIVESKLAACVQVLPEMRSFYFWEGRVRSEPEVLILIKTLENKFADLESFIRERHSYEVPEIVAIPSAEISEGYLNWMEAYLAD